MSGPVRAPRRVAAVCLAFAAVLASAGCTSEPRTASQGAAESATSIESPAPPPTGADEPSSAEVSAEAEGGIAAEEAKDRGVFLADYDARLELVSQNGSAVTLRLVNVSEKDDSYRLRLDPDTAGDLTPEAVSLAAGASTEVTVELLSAADLRVFSSGRGDAEVAAVSLGPR